MREIFRLNPIIACVDVTPVQSTSLEIECILLRKADYAKVTIYAYLLVIDERKLPLIQRHIPLHLPVKLIHLPSFSLNLYRKVLKIICGKGLSHLGIIRVQVGYRGTDNLGLYQPNLLYLILHDLPGFPSI